MLHGLARSRRGSALLVAIVLVVAVMGLAGSYLVVSSRFSWENHQRTLSSTAQIWAETGLDHARHWLASSYEMDPYGNKTTGWDDDLVGPDGSTNTEDDGLPPFGEVVHVGKAAYSVRIEDNNDGDGNEFIDSDDKVVVVSRAWTEGGDERQEIAIRAVVMHEPFDPTSEYAILVGKDLYQWGNPEVKGTLASVHANRNVSLSGSVLIERDAEASGTLTITGGNVQVLGRKEANAPIVAIPPIDPTRYRAQATYVFTSTGQVKNASGVVLWTSPGGNAEWNGWKWKNSDKSWNWSGQGQTKPPAGVSYFETNVNMTGSPGTQNSPWVAMVISEKNIAMGGNPTIVPPSGNTEVLIAGQDIALLGTSGGGTPQYQGIIAAHEQIYFGGTANLIGRVVAEDAPSSPGSIIATSEIADNAVYGNAKITYNDLLNMQFVTQYRVPIVSWTLELATNVP